MDRRVLFNCALNTVDYCILLYTVEDLNEVTDKMIENEPIINMVESLRKLQIGKHLDFSRCRPGGKCGSYFGVNVRHPL